MVRRVFLGIAATVAITFGATASAQQTGTLKARFVFDGPPPAADPINPNKDIEYCGKHPLVDESLLVNPTNNGIRNVLLYVYTGRGGAKLPKIAPAKAVHILANDKCRFEPHIVVAQAGDTLNVTNPDPVGHNANIGFFENAPVNFTIPPGGMKAVDMPKAEPAPIPVECNIHPWMRAYVMVLDHPYAAVTDENGAMTIEGLPAGGKLNFRLFQEGARKIDSVTIGGKQVALRGNRLDIDIKPGVNDLGDIKIPAAAFK